MHWYRDAWEKSLRQKGISEKEIDVIGLLLTSFVRRHFQASKRKRTKKKWINRIRRDMRFVHEGKLQWVRQPGMKAQRTPVDW